jgi:uncharacterized metal-binding protein YceD (DUF177 family)
MPLFNILSEVNVDAVRSDARNFYKLAVTDSDLACLAMRFGWVSVGALTCEMRIQKVARACWDVHGHITAQVCQNCVVTSEPVVESIDFQIEERYVRVSDQGDEVEVEVGLDGVESLHNGAIDIGELVVQSLALAVTTWPRADGAPESYTLGNQDIDHPFAELSVLKRKTQK